MQTSTNEVKGLLVWALDHPAAHPNTDPNASSAPPSPGSLADQPMTAEGIEQCIILRAGHDPDAPIIWGRKPWPTYADNRAALRVAFQFDIEVVHLYNGWAQFSGFDYNVRIEPDALGDDRAGFSWAENLLTVSFLDNASAISSGSEHVLGICFPLPLDVEDYEDAEDSEDDEEDTEASEDNENDEEVSEEYIPNGSPETFSLFKRLPAELRREVALHALPPPGVFYYQLHPRHVRAAPIRCNDFPSSLPNSHSTWRNWEPGHAATFRELARIGGLEAACLDRGGLYPFYRGRDLIVFGVSCYNGWTDELVAASPDGVYDRFGKGLKYVALPYDPRRYTCSCPHKDGTLGWAAETGNPWNMVYTEAVGLYCDGPCKAAVCRYVSFFRDSEVMYFMLYIRQQDIRDFWKRVFVYSGHVPFVAKQLLERQKGTFLSTTSSFSQAPAPVHSFCLFPLQLQSVHAANAKHKTSQEPRQVRGQYLYVGRVRAGRRHHAVQTLGAGRLGADALPRVLRAGPAGRHQGQGQPAHEVQGAGYYAPAVAQDEGSDGPGLVRDLFRLPPHVGGCAQVGYLKGKKLW